MKLLQWIKAICCFNLRRLLLVLVIIVINTDVSLCGSSEIVKFLKKTQIINNSSLTIKDNLYFSEEVNNSVNYVSKRNTVLRLKYTRDNQTDEDANYWTYTINYTLNPGNNTGTLIIKKGKTEKVYEAISAINNNQPNSTVKINSVIATYSLDDVTYYPVTNPASSSNIPDDIQLEIAIQTERYLATDNSTPIEVNFDPTNNTVYWTYLSGAEEYELEWVYIDDMVGTNLNDPIIPPVFTNIDDPYLYKEPVNIITKQHEFKFDMTYSSGTLYFRVRGIGRHIVGVNGDFSYINASRLWGYTEFHLNSEFEPNLNMISTTNFAEDGKHKTIVSYSDGLLRTLQTQTISSTENVNITKTERYDYEGRPSVNILPVPIDNRDLNYKSNLNISNSGNGLFDKTQFDEGSSNSIGTLNGAGQYFSNNNNFFTDPLRNYIPDCDGYSYAQTKYSHDNTGRIVGKSGLGPDLKIGSGHETKFLYSFPNNVELQRLFGSSVGNFSHYRKNYKIDPNKQVSAVYLDQEGRTIATCLVGNTTEGLLDADPEASSGTNLMVDVSSGNEIVEDDGLISRNVIYVTNEQPGKEYTFHYNLDQARINSSHTEFNMGFEDNEQIEDPSINNLISNTYAFSGSHSLYLNQNWLILKKFVVKANDIINTSAFIKYIQSIGESASIFMSLESPDKIGIPGYWYHRNTTATGWQYIDFSMTVPPNPSDIIMPPNGDPYNYDYFILTVGLAAPSDWSNLPQPSYFDDIKVEIIRDGQICPSCAYDLSIKIKDPDGNLLTPPITRTISNSVQYIDCDHDYYIPSNSDIVLTEIFNQVGTYTIIKELKVNEQSLIDLSNDLHSVNGEHYPDYPNQTAMIDESTMNLDYTECDYSCYDICRNWLLENNGTEPTVPEIEQCMKQNCETNAINTIQEEECDNMLTRMRIDISPGGSLYNNVAWWNQLKSNIGCFSGLTFMDNEGNVFTVSTTTDIDYLKDPLNWVESWEDNLVRLHPEYCQYEKCMWSKPFRKYMLEMTELYSHLDPNNMWNTAANYTSYINSPSGQIINYTAPANPSTSVHDPILDAAGCTSSGGTTVAGLISAFQYKVNNIYYQDPNNSSLTYNLRQYCEQQISINPNFYSNHGETFQVSPVPTNQQKQWMLFVSIYSGLRDQLLKDILDCHFSTCGYYPTTIPPALYNPPIVENPNDYNSFNSVQDIVIDCNNSNPSSPIYSECPQCNSNVLTWIATINQNCIINDETGLRKALFNLCTSNLSFENPFGMLTDEILNPTSPGIPPIDFNDFCNCPTPIDPSGIVASDYSITLSNNSYFTQGSIVIPSYIKYFISLLARAGESNNYPFTDLNLDCSQCREIIRFFGGGNVSYWLVVNPDIFNNNDIYHVFFMDINGNLIGTNTIENYQYGSYNNTHPLSIDINNAVFDLNYFGTGVAYTGVRVPVTLLSGETINAYICANPGQALIPGGYCYESLDIRHNLEVHAPWTFPCLHASPFPSELLYTQVPSNITLPNDFDPPVYNPTDCVNEITMAASENAEDEHEELVNEYITDYISNHESYCLGLKEKFTYEYKSYDFNFTLYYFDQSGELVQTVPPEDVKKGILDPIHFPNGIWDETEPVYLMPTKYSYNSAGDIIEQSTPDAGISKYIYSKTNQLRLSQNSKQALSQKWTYYKYDNINRIIETGEYFTTSSPSSLESFVNNSNYPYASSYDLYEVKRTFYDDPIITPIVLNAENLIGRISSIAYYDMIPHTGTADYSWATHYSYDMHGNVKTLLQENKYLQHFPSQQYKRFDYSYDLISGKVNQLIYQKDEPDEFIHKYYYDADNKITNVFTSRDGFIWDQDAEYFYYKHGPLARVEIGNDKVQGTDYVYTINGWLKGVNSNTLIAKRDIGNDGHLRYSNLNKFIGQDAMSYNIGYFEGDYSPIGFINNDNNAFASNFSNIYGAILPSYYSLYNGNISSVVSNIYDIVPIQPHIYQQIPLIKTYKYDQLNRLRLMSSAKFSSSTSYNDFIITNDWPNYTSLSDSYQESFNYDLNGNILTVQRWDEQLFNIDNLTYQYETSGSRLLKNRLLQVKDMVTNNPLMTYDVKNQVDVSNPTDWNYTYDNIGNLIHDRSEHIQNIVWTIDGKVKEVVRIPGSTKDDLEYCYDPSGNRISKTVKPKDSFGNLLPVHDWQYTYYIRDAQGNIAAVYDRNITIGGSTTTETIKLVEQPIYGTSRIGYDMTERVTETATHPWIPNQTYDAHGNVAPGILFQANNTLNKSLQFNILSDFSRLMGKRNYELNDHLGNVLTTISDLKTCESNSPENQIIETHFEGDGKEYFGDYSVFNVEVDPENSANHIVNIETAVPGQYNFGPCFKIRVYPNDVITVSSRMHSDAFSSDCGKLVAGITDGDGHWLKDNYGLGNSQYFGSPSSLSAGWQLITTFNQYVVPSDLPQVDLYLNVQTFIFDDATPTGFDDLSITILPASSQKKYISDITSVSDYYSFGMLMPERSHNISILASGGYRYGFNSKEKDDEWTGSAGATYDYGFRIYDSRIAKFLSVDPLTKEYPWYTPYQFAGNTPIEAIDLDGAEELHMNTDPGSITPYARFEGRNWAENLAAFVYNVTAASLYNASSSVINEGYSLLNNGPVLYTWTKGYKTYQFGKELYNSEISWSAAYTGLTTLQNWEAPASLVFGAGLSLLKLGNFNSALNFRPKIAKFEAIKTQAVKTSTKAVTSYYPKNSGALGKWSTEYLMPGTKIDRFGSGFGKYFSPHGTPMSMRALPPGNTGAYNAFEVVKPFPVQSSTIAPAFNQMGLGTQYLSPVNMNTLLKRGIIVPLK